MDRTTCDGVHGRGNGVTVGVTVTPFIDPVTSTAADRE